PGRLTQHAEQRPDARAVVVPRGPFEVPTAEREEFAAGTLSTFGQEFPPVLGRARLDRAIARPASRRAPRGDLRAVVRDVAEVRGVLLLNLPERGRLP